MTASLTELSRLVESCALKLEQEIRDSIETSGKKIFNNEFTNSKLVLEQAKDYHNKEIIKLISEIIKSIRQIVSHKGKIKQLDNMESISQEELGRYVVVKQRTHASSKDKEIRRELRRTASTNSVNCVNIWETYMVNEELTKNALCTSLPNVSTVPKRKSPNEKRKQKKLISSTFENILEVEERQFKRMEMLSEETSSSDASEISSEFTKSLKDVHSDLSLETKKTNFSYENLREEQEGREKRKSQFNEVANMFDECMELLGNELESPTEEKIDTKPKIVGCVMKKNVNLDMISSKEVLNDLVYKESEDYIFL